MTASRLNIDLHKVQQNAQMLVRRLGERGISVTGITKAILGTPEIADVLLRAGVQGIGDSRIENIETMRDAQLPSSMTLIRTPMLSQVERVVRHADASFNTELAVIKKLSAAAQKARRTHGVVLMVELGDLREGILPSDLNSTVRDVLRLPNIELMGLGTNLACLSGVSPDVKNMAELSRLADSIDASFGIVLGIVSGGNSGNMQWALSGADPGRINNLRLGESLLLGRETLRHQPIDGLHTDAFTLTAEVIEAKLKPSLPWGEIAENAFGETPDNQDRGQIAQLILAVGRQDVDPDGLSPPPGIEIIGSSSDHLVLDAGRHRISVGDEITFQINYSALLRAMTSPFIAKELNYQGIESGQPSTKVHNPGSDHVQPRQPVLQTGHPG
jgi:predicted amino acid racemase